MSETVGISTEQFERVFNKLRPKCEVIAYSYVRDMDVAKDLVHDCFLTIWERRDSIEDINIEAYIYCVVRSKCLHHIRHEKTGQRIRQNIHGSTQRVMDYYINSIESCNPDTLFETEIAKILEEQLNCLPELTRDIFKAHRFEGMTYKSISEKHNISINKVTSEIQRALSALRISFKDYLLLLAAFITIKMN